jgi:predicted N-acetyltransferase YhbS
MERITMPELVPLHIVTKDGVEKLLDRSFGLDRHNRTAYRLRIGSTEIPSLSFALINEGSLLASIQCWPVAISGTKLVLVGPVAVDPDHHNKGHGRHLMRSMLEAGEKIGNPAMVMIGDPEYYARFGFSAEACAGWRVPGPWEARRLLVRNIAGHILPEQGMLERADAL